MSAKICRYVMSGLIAFGAVAEAAADAPADISDMNVLIILIDALRADHLGCYGYARNTSPNIDALAAKSTIFERATSCSSATMEVIPTLFTGIFPSLSGTGLGWVAMPTPSRKHLAEYFTEAGYATALLTDTHALFDPLFDRGFAETDHMIQVATMSDRNEELSLRVLEFVRNKQSGLST